MAAYMADQGYRGLRVVARRTVRRCSEEGGAPTASPTRVVGFAYDGSGNLTDLTDVGGA
jgi:uncharacterized protein RhaS with RHS repeats